VKRCASDEREVCAQVGAVSPHGGREESVLELMEVYVIAARRGFNGPIRVGLLRRKYQAQISDCCNVNS
jgi:hypothetical protein